MRKTRHITADNSRTLCGLTLDRYSNHRAAPLCWFPSDALSQGTCLKCMKGVG